MRDCMYAAQGCSHVCVYTLIDALHEHAYVYTGVLAFNISMVFMSVSTSLCMCSCTRRKGYVSYLYRQEYGAPGHPGPWWVPFKYSCYPASFGRFRGIYISSRIPFRAPPTLHWSAQCLGVPNWVPKTSLVSKYLSLAIRVRGFGSRLARLY
jgi:hypothetical protein